VAAAKARAPGLTPEAEPEPAVKRARPASARVRKKRRPATPAVEVPDESED